MSRQKKGDIETNYEVRSFDADITLEQYKALPKIPLYIVLDNLRSAFNVGSIFRLCDALRVSGLFLCGYTAHPPHIKLEKTSLGAAKYVPWQYFKTTHDSIAYLKSINVPVWAAETTSLSTPYTEVEFPMPVAIVFGNETSGISREILDICDKIIEIPMHGFKNSVNVAASAAVLGYAAAAKCRIDNTAIKKPV
jgi:tRNA G18 (ribose-2'-O)-methylase SpoU